MKPKDELRHLRFGAVPNDTMKGFALLLFKIHCQGNANVVLQNCREILGIVLQQYETVWLSEEEWRQKLPDWFVKSCARERTLEEEEEDLIR